MPFVAAKCPQCGGDLQLDNQMETGFCMHCGSKIIVQEAVRKVRIDNSQMIETWMKMGNSAAEAGNHKEAYDYFTKVVENNPNNWQATFLKGKAAGWQSTYGNPRFTEFFQGIGDAQKIIIKLNLSDKEVAETNIEFASATYHLTLAYSQMVDGILKKKIFAYVSDLEIIKGCYEAYINCLNYLEIGLGLVNGNDDEKAKKYKLAFMQSLYNVCIILCKCWPYQLSSHGDIYYWGYPLQQKQKFITLFDKVGSEIRKLEPDFGNGNFIDRLEPPQKYDSDSNIDVRDSANKRLQEKVDRESKIKEAEDQKKKYWEEHPEEYKAHLEEEKRKKDEIEEKKSRAKKELSEKVIQEEEIKKNIDELKKEREKLGIFAGRQKKVIDNKVIALEQEIRKLKDRIEVLKNF